MNKLIQVKEYIDLNNKKPSRNDKSEVIYSSLGWLQFQKGTKREGIRYYKKSLEISPDYLTSLINLGSYFAESKDYGNARYLLETAFKKSPSNLSLINNYAVTLMALGEPADDIFEAGLKLNSSGTANIDFLINYSIYLIRVKKNYVKGKEILNKINFIGAATDRRNVILNLEESIKR
jgi:tetratricopeptide (TPR) repeat protein